MSYVIKASTINEEFVRKQAERIEALVNSANLKGNSNEVYETLDTFILSPIDPKYTLRKLIEKDDKYFAAYTYKVNERVTFNGFMPLENPVLPHFVVMNVQRALKDASGVIKQEGMPDFAWTVTKGKERVQSMPLYQTEDNIEIPEILAGISEKTALGTAPLTEIAEVV